MNSFLQMTELTRLLTEVLAPFESAALMNGDGELLGIKYETITDIGTFGPCIQTARKYFQPKEGDVILSNDPYSGGTILSVMSLVTGFQLGDQNFYLAIRTRFKPRMVNATRLEDEGIRIPPTPIASRRQLNETIIEAISTHPQAPIGLSPRFNERLQVLWRQIDLLKSWAARSPGILSKATQKTLLSETQKRISHRIMDLPHGDQRFDLLFETGEVIRMHTEIQNDGIHFDFTGTSNSKRLFLTDAATYGTCMAGILAFLGEDFLLNEGLYSLVTVTTPEGCFLNARYPSPLFEGVAEASSLLAAATVQSLASITSSRSTGLNGAIPTILSFEFGNGKTYFDGMSGGTGASSDSVGIDGYFHWSLNKLQPSVEEIERQYPLRLLQSGIRQGSGGKGSFAGGNGVLRETEVFADCTLKWLLGHRNTQIKGLKGATSGMASEITVLKTSGEKISLTTSRGEIKLQKGDRVTAASAGGGGFGKAND
jgi:N-methylhydantoinase B/oxoprolinase/acetone carboxylase alpha subunit